MELEGVRISRQLLVDFNRQQRSRGFWSVIAGLLLVGLSFLFFWGGMAFTLSNFDVENAKFLGLGIASVLTIIVVASGVVRYRKGLGAIDYWDSVDSILPRDGSTAAVYSDRYVTQVTAPALAVSQMILAGPRYFLGGLERRSRLVETSEEMATRMERIRTFLDTERKFHPVGQFANEIDALRYLGWMGVATLAPRDEQLKVRISLEAQSRRS